MPEQKQNEHICGNCGLWRKMDAQGPVEIGAEPRGFCYALPPTPFPKIDPRTGQQIAQGHCRPCPLASEFCSMFVPREGLLNG